MVLFSDPPLGDGESRLVISFWAHLRQRSPFIICLPILEASKSEHHNDDAPKEETPLL